jgi:6-phospho-beta-glucosidase
MRRLCPEAWLINFSNPSGLVAEALQRYAPETRTVGLCNSPIGHQMRLAKELHVAPEQVQLRYLGLNHLAWLTGATVDGQDVWPQVFPAYLEHLRAEEDPEFPPYLIELLGAIPSGYLHYYYRTAAVLAHQRTHPTRAADVMNIERDLLARYADPALTILPEELMLRGGAYYSTAAGQLIASLHLGDDRVHVVNTRHLGTVPGWPADWVCELPCRVDTTGVHPLPAEPLPTLCDGLVHAVKAYELLAAEAARSGDRGAALQALAAHPLGPGADDAPALLDDLLATHAPHLPLFWGRA